MALLEKMSQLEKEYGKYLVEEEFERIACEKGIPHVEWKCA
jgi:hypothetical protein